MKGEARAALLFAIAVAIGCATENAADRQEVMRQVQRHEPADAAQAAVILSVRGRWVADIEATLRVNPPEARGEIRRDMEAHPLELEVTETDYISRTPTKTVWDKYNVVRVDGQTVEIELLAPAGEKEPVATTVPATGERHARLRVVDGRLMIRNKGWLTVVMSRAVAR